MRKVLWALKYRNKKILAKPLGRALYDRLLEELEEQKTFKGFSEPILIPIPMSKKRLKERGYNQSELLCKELFLLGSDTFTLDTDVLHKQKETPRQATIKDRKKRLKNLHNSFSVVHSEKIMNKNILLVDDITTTGATLYEAIKVLKKAGAHKVIAITIAH
jgi:ComF family protein